MGAKKRSTTTSRTPPPDTDIEDLPFKPGEQVLCRYSSYPYWPATIDRCHQTRAQGKFFRYSNQSSAEPVLTFWCTFADEDTGGWVRVNRIVRYHPSLADRIRVPSGHMYYEDQCKAIQAANRDFQTLDTVTDIPDVPSDFDQEDNDDDEVAVGGDAEEEKEDEPIEEEDENNNHASEGKTVRQRKRSASKSSERKRKRRSTPSRSDRPRKKKISGNVDNQETKQTSSEIKVLEAKLSAACDTIEELKRTLHKRDHEMSQIFGGKHPVRVAVPPSPAPVDMKVPSLDECRIKRMSTEQFRELFHNIKSEFHAFKVIVKLVNTCRAELDEETNNVQPRFVVLVRNLIQAEKQAAKCEQRLCEALKKALQGDIGLDALREHKAGIFIRSLGKQCREMPLLYELCSLICSVWRDQVTSLLNMQGDPAQTEAKVEANPDMTIRKTNSNMAVSGRDSEITSGPAAERKPNEAWKSGKGGSTDDKTADNTSEVSPRGTKSRRAKHEGEEEGPTPSPASTDNAKDEECADEIEALKDEHESERQMGSKVPSARGPHLNITKPHTNQLSEQEGGRAMESVLTSESKHVADSDEDIMDVESSLSTTGRQAEMQRTGPVNASESLKSGSKANDGAHQGKPKIKSARCQYQARSSDLPVEIIMTNPEDEVKAYAEVSVSDREKISDRTNDEGNHEIFVEPNGGSTAVDTITAVVNPHTVNSKEQVDTDSRKRFKKQSRTTEGMQGSSNSIPKSKEGEDSTRNVGLGIKDKGGSDHSTSAETPGKVSKYQSETNRGVETRVRDEQNTKELEWSRVNRKTKEALNDEKLLGSKNVGNRVGQRAADCAQSEPMYTDNTGTRSENNRQDEGKCSIEVGVDATDSFRAEDAEGVDEAEEKDGTGASVAAQLGNPN